MYDILSPLISGAITDFDKVLCLIVFFMLLEVFSDIVCTLISMGGRLK